MPAHVVAPPRPSTTGGKAASYSVLRIDYRNGTVQYEVVDSVSVKNREADIQRAYLKAAREWKANADPEAPTPQPPKPEVRVWRVVMGGPDGRERAEAVAAQCRRSEKEGKRLDPEPSAEPDKAPGDATGVELPPSKKIPEPTVK
ncbi:MAG TPA: hypothetical protein PLE19_23860 [Planctomycetota bacterium]|nr:hypothetical protein [Planctomycetota bacterium]HRR83244.1 hypothetical protein [Planctomycetota bacterium]HRT97450.1 hypothetical protein [Planctomycetota bacterium]